MIDCLYELYNCIFLYFLIYNTTIAIKAQGFQMCNYEFFKSYNLKLFITKIGNQDREALVPYMDKPIWVILNLILLVFP